MLNLYFFIFSLFSIKTTHAGEYFTKLMGDCISTGNQIYSTDFPNDFETPNLCRFEVQKSGWIVSTQLSAMNIEVVVGRDIYPSFFTHGLSEPIDQQVWQYDMIQIVALTDRDSGSFLFELVEDECNESDLESLFVVFDKVFYVDTDCSDPNLSTAEICQCLTSIEPRETDRLDCIWNVHSWNPRHVKSMAEYCRDTTCDGSACECDLNQIRAEIPNWVSTYGQQVEEPCNTMVDLMESNVYTDQIICGCLNEIPQDLSYVLGCTFGELELSFAAKSKECRGYRDPTISPSATLPSFSPTFPPSLSPSIAPSLSLPTLAPSASEPSFAPVTSPPSSRPSTRPSQSLPSVSPTSNKPSSLPSMTPSTACPSNSPVSSTPTAMPTPNSPSQSPITSLPSINPITTLPSQHPVTTAPSFSPSNSFPSTSPSKSPSNSLPTAMPTVSFPSTRPTSLPTQTPSYDPTSAPITSVPSQRPSNFPHSTGPSATPSIEPTPNTPTASPSKGPTVLPSVSPSSLPSIEPTPNTPTASPSKGPTVLPSVSPSSLPTSSLPSKAPISTQPSYSPSFSDPTNEPSMSEPSQTPSVLPTSNPTFTTPTISPSKLPSITLYLDEIVLDENFSVVTNVTTFCVECTEFVQKIPSVTKVSCINARAGSIIIEIQGPEEQNQVAKDYVAAFGMNLTCCGVLGGMEIQTSLVIETSLVGARLESETSDTDPIYTFGLFGLAGALVLVIFSVAIWCCCCRPKPHLVKFLEEDDKLSESDIITDFNDKREPRSSKREPQTAKRQPQTLAGSEKSLPSLQNLVMDSVSHSQIDLTPRTTAPPPKFDVQVQDLQDLPQEGAEYDYDDCGGDSMRLLPLIDREFEEALEFDPEFVYLKDLIALRLGQAAKYEPGAIRSQWETQLQFSKDALLKLCRLRFGDERTENYIPRLKRIWRETSEVARRLSVTSVRGLFFRFFDITNDGDIHSEEFKSIATLVCPDIEPYAIDETFNFIDTSSRGSFTPIEIQTFLDKQWGGRARKFRQAIIDYMSCHSIQETHEALEPKLKRRPEIDLNTDSNAEDELLDLEDTETFGKELLQKMRQLRKDMDNRRLSTAFDDDVEDDEDDIRIQMQHNPTHSLESVPENEESFDSFSENTYLARETEKEVHGSMDFDEDDLAGVVRFDSDSESVSSLEKSQSPELWGRHISRNSGGGSVHEVDFDLASATI